MAAFSYLPPRITVAIAVPAEPGAKTQGELA
jgi:hypothetical protein